jgi:large conductance mechanosensitive channel protein
MKKIWNEFKEFAVKGNAVDLAIGVIIGAAFSSIINSLVKDVAMPPISLLTGGLDFSNKFVILRAAKDGSTAFNTPADAAKAGAITWNYGNFVTLLINFLIVAGAVFLLVRVINQLRQPAEKEPDTKDCPACAMKIPIKATRCPHCTTELSSGAPSQTPAEGV